MSSGRSSQTPDKGVKCIMIGVCVRLPPQGYSPGPSIKLPRTGRLASSISKILGVCRTFSMSRPNVSDKALLMVS